MDQQPVKEIQRLTSSGENLGSRFVFEAKNMTYLVLKAAGNGLDRNLLLKQQESLVKTLDEIWEGVENGLIEVECLPLLRTARTVSCPEISRKLQSPEIDHVKIIRDLRLLVNTFTFVIKPKSSNFSF